MGAFDVVGPPITDVGGASHGFDPLLLHPLSSPWCCLLSDLAMFEAGQLLEASLVIGVPIEAKQVSLVGLRGWGVGL